MVVDENLEFVVTVDLDERGMNEVVDSGNHNLDVVVGGGWELGESEVVTPNGFGRDCDMREEET